MPIVCDPAGQGASQSDGQSLIDHYASLGVYMNKADNNLESGLMHMLERMQSGRLKVFDDLEGWWREFRLYRRDKQGKVVKKHDHLLDATRYIISSGLPLACSPPTENKQKKRQKRSGWTTI